jgi:methyl-accepting chemotaxis protein
MQNLSIKIKLFIPISLLILGVVIFQVLYFPSTERDQALVALSTKGTSICRLVAHGIGSALDFDDLDSIKKRFEGAAQDGDLLYIAIFKENGDALAELNLKDAPRLPNGLFKDEVKTAFDDDLQILEVFFPVHSEAGIKATLVAGFKMHSITAQHDRTQRVGLIIGGVILAIGLSVAYALGSTSASRLRLLADASEAIANGDLTINLHQDPRADEIGRMASSFSKMLLNQRELVTQIARTAQRISQTSDQILSSSERQAQGALEQSASVEDTRRTTDSLISSSSEIADAAGGVLSYAEQTLTNNRQITERISQLAIQTQRITEILDSIKDIANKTDLLALNAALEGTKAGEAGRGFSLVANQMQRLADNVMRSALDIKSLTADMRDSTNASVLSAEEATKLASSTTQSARRIHQIVQHQQNGTQEVSIAMNNVRVVAQRTVDGTRQTISVTRQLVELSTRLRHLVDRFKISASDIPFVPQTLSASLLPIADSPAPTPPADSAT